MIHHDTFEYQLFNTPTLTTTQSQHLPSQPTAMPSTIRLELFPATLPPSISFYTKILNFTILRHEPGPGTTEYGYAHLNRDTINLGLSTKPPSDYPALARDVAARPQFRKWPVGVEIVMEVDDV